MRELLSNNSLIVGQLYEDKSLTLPSCNLISFTTDLQIITQQFTARADLFLNCTRQSEHEVFGTYHIFKMKVHNSPNPELYKSKYKLL